MNYFQRLWYVIKSQKFALLLLFGLSGFFLKFTNDKSIILDAIIIYGFIVFWIHGRMYPAIINNSYDLPEQIRRDNFTLEEKCKQYIIDIFENEYKSNKEFKCSFKICKWYEIENFEKVIEIAKIIRKYNSNIEENIDVIYKEIYDVVNE